MQGKTVTSTLPDSNPKQVSIDTGVYLKKIARLANNDQTGRWPANAAMPAEGSIVPYKRVVAFYGNFYSANMGILGEYPTPVLLEKIKAQTSLWKDADSLTEVIPAVHYIAVTAQGSAGDGYYRLRMPEKEIMKAIALGDSIQGLIFLDVQPGLSTLLKLPQCTSSSRLPGTVADKFSRLGGGASPKYRSP